MSALEPPVNAPDRKLSARRQRRDEGDGALFHTHKFGDSLAAGDADDSIADSELEVANEIDVVRAAFLRSRTGNTDTCTENPGLSLRANIAETLLVP